MSHAIRIHSHGGPEVLHWDAVDPGTPGPGEILLRQTAVGLNFIDIYQRTGLYPIPLPFIPGQEGAGRVEALGDGVTDLAVGDRVAYAGPLGGYAEIRRIAADRVVKLPDAIDEEIAAAAMLQGMTVRYLIRVVKRLEAGDTILIHAAAGGVGLILCQWAASLGVTVIGTVSTEEKAALALANGCAHVIDYTKEDFVTRVTQITDGRKLPVIYDSIGRDTFLRSLDCLRPRGLAVTFGQSSGPIGPVDLGILAQKGSLCVTRPTLASFIATRAELVETAQDLFDVIASGKVRIQVNQRFPLKEAAAAQAALEARRTTGSTVLIP